MFEVEIRIKALIPTLKAHPEVGQRLNFGLSGNTFLDHVIGLVEEAVDAFPQDNILRACYQTLQREYPSYFSSAVPGIKSEEKNPAYKSCNGF